MKANKWKKIIIRNPNLRQLRKNLRSVIKFAVDDELKRLRQIGYLYTNKRIEKGLTPSQQKRSFAISKLKRDLRHSYSSSIIKCMSGSGCITSKKQGKPHYIISLDVDMVWNPLDESWICINCYNHYFSSEELRFAYKSFLERDKAIDKRLTEKYNLGQPLTKEEDEELEKCLSNLKFPT